MISRLSLQHTDPTAVASTNMKQKGTISMQSPQVRSKQEDVSSLHSLSPHNDQLSSSSSLSNTDSDSLRSIQQNVIKNHSSPQTTTTTTNNNNNSITAPSKSPILIKYNYYDYNGARQEQENHNMHYMQQQHDNNSHYDSHQLNHHHHHQHQVGKVQRHLSPTFKQSLDQIVRNSQQLVQQSVSSSNSPVRNSSSSISSPPSSPEHQQLVAVQLARRYKLSSYEQRCLRCNKTVYQMDKVGPLKDFTFYHQNCFKCFECGTKLTLKTYFNNQQHSGDQEVYCHRHCPKTGPGRLDNQSVGIRAALNAPKVFDGVHQVVGASSIDNNGNPAHAYYERDPDDNGSSPNVDSRALYIQHAVQQTRLYKKTPLLAYQSQHPQQQQHQLQHLGEKQKEQQLVDNKKLTQLINRRLEFLEPKQKLLELRHREEEDALFKAFELKWRQEESFISEQIREEWQVELGKLLEKYKRQLSNISNQPVQHQQVASAASASNAAAVAAAAATAAAHLARQLQQQTEEARRLKRQLEETGTKGEETRSKQQMIELERMNLEKTMTIKLDRKKETLKRKLKEFERQATAELVEKQSKEMLALISMKLNEYKEEQKRKFGSDLEQFEAIDSLANQLGSSLQLPGTSNGYNNNNNSVNGQQQQQQVLIEQQLCPTAASVEQQQLRVSSHTLMEVPPPKPPQISKMELYNNEEADQVFKDIDQLAINVAREDQQSFTDLVHHLTRHCITDVEKVRAIFRWITVKNLNTMQFDSSVKPDTPLGLLRGIKNGSESYHVLFKRLCSYAGLHCVVIKGYSKSAGYQPGVKFECNKFRNSWNAVYVAGAWRFVQCNWGARHLVSVAVMQDKNNGKATSGLESPPHPLALPSHAVPSIINAGRSQRYHHHHHHHHQQQQQQQQHSHSEQPPNHGRRGQSVSNGGNNNNNNNSLSPSATQFEMRSSAVSGRQQLAASAKQHQSSSSRSPASSSSSCSSPSSSDVGCSSSSSRGQQQQQHQSASAKSSSDSLRYEYDDHYFLTDPDEFIYEFHPLSPEWQLIKTRPITLSEFEQLPFVRSLFFKYGLYFPQHDIRSVLHTDSSGATTIKIGMPTHMIPSLIFHYNLKYYDSDLEHYEGVSLKRFVMQSIESGACDGSNGQSLLSNIVSFRVHLPENGAYILDIFANSTTPTQYITGEPMKFKSVCKFKIIAKNLKTVMIPLPDCASGEYGPMKATRLFGIIPITHENALIVVQNEKRFLEIQFRMTRPLIDFMASLHKNGYDERQLSKSIKIFIDGDIVFVTVKFFEDGQYGLDLYTRDQLISTSSSSPSSSLHHESKSKRSQPSEPRKQLLTHCCKYLINVRASNNR